VLSAPLAVLVPAFVLAGGLSMAWNGLSFEGAWAWRWKDRIDRKFIARYR